MEKLNVVIVGVGHDHAHDVYSYVTEKDSSFNLVGIVILDDEEDNYNKYKSDYDLYERLTIDDVLRLEDLDGVFIECDEECLSYIAGFFTDCGINVHMDKPGGQNKDEFDEVVDMAKENGSVFHLGYMYRYNPAIKEALRLCREGAIGKILSIEAQMNTYLKGKKEEWLNNFDGGMMNFLGCHLIDVVVMFQGMPDSVTSFDLSSDEDKGNDMSLAVLRYGNGFSTVNATNIEVDGFSRRRIVIIGEKGVIEISPTEIFNGLYIKSRCKYKPADGNTEFFWEEKEFGPVHRYGEMLEEFAEIIRGEKENPYDAEYEIMVHDVLLAACKRYGSTTSFGPRGVFL